MHNHIQNLFFFFFNDTATTEIYTLSLHDALPISSRSCGAASMQLTADGRNAATQATDLYKRLDTGQDELYVRWYAKRSEEHTSELQSRLHLVCRLLLEKKKDVATSQRRPRTADNV